MVSPACCKIALRKRKGSLGGKFGVEFAERVLIFYVAAGGLVTKTSSLLAAEWQNTLPSHTPTVPKRDGQYHRACSTVSARSSVKRWKAHLFYLPIQSQPALKSTFRYAEYPRCHGKSAALGNTKVLFVARSKQVDIESCGSNA